MATKYWLASPIAIVAKIIMLPLPMIANDFQNSKWEVCLLRDTAAETGLVIAFRSQMALI